MQFFPLLLFLLPLPTYQLCSGSPTLRKSNIEASSFNSFVSIEALSNSYIALAYYSSPQAAKFNILAPASGVNVTAEMSINGAYKPVIAPLQYGFAVCYTIGSLPYFQIYTNAGANFVPQVQVSASPGNNFIDCAGLTVGGLVVCYGVSATNSIDCALYDEGGNLLVSGASKTTATASMSYRFTVTPLRQGGYVVAYPIGQDIYGGVFDYLGNRLVAEFKMNSNAMANNEFFSLSGLSNGGFVLGFYSSTGIYVAGFKADGTVLFAETLSSASQAYMPSVAGNSVGGFIVAFTGSGGGVDINAYDSNGVKLNTALIVAASTGNMNDNTGATFNSQGLGYVPQNVNQDVYLVKTIFSGCAFTDAGSLPFPSIIIGNGTTSTNITNATNSTNGSITNNATNSSNNTSNGSNSSRPIPSNSTTTTQNSQSYLSKALNTAILITVTVATGTSFMSGTNPTLLWGFMGFLQQYFYLLFLNVNTPENLKSFLKIFAFANLDFIPDFTDDLNLPNERSPPKFYENGFTGLFLKTMGSNIQLWLIVSFITITLSYLRRQNHLSTKIRLILMKCCPIRMWVDSIPPFVISIFLQLKTFGINSPGLGSSVVLGIVLLAMIALTPIMFAWVIKRNKSHSMILHPLFEDFDMNNSKSKYFPVYELLVKIIEASIIVYVYYYPTHQVLGIGIVEGLYFCCMLMVFPRKTKKENYFYLFLEFLNVGIHLGFSAFLYDYQESERDVIGWTIMAVIIFSVILNMSPLIYEEVKTLCRLKKKSVYEKKRSLKHKLTDINIKNSRINYTRDQMDSNNHSLATLNSPQNVGISPNGNEIRNQQQPKRERFESANDLLSKDDEAIIRNQTDRPDERKEIRIEDYTTNKIEQNVKENANEKENLNFNLEVQDTNLSAFLTSEDLSIKKSIEEMKLRYQPYPAEGSYLDMIDQLNEVISGSDAKIEIKKKSILINLNDKIRNQRNLLDE